VYTISKKWKVNQSHQIKSTQFSGQIDLILKINWCVYWKQLQ
jgi:hypothetical protein